MRGWAGRKAQQAADEALVAKQAAAAVKLLSEKQAATEHSAAAEPAGVSLGRHLPQINCVWQQSSNWLDCGCVLNVLRSVNLRARCISAALIYCVGAKAAQVRAQAYAAPDLKPSVVAPAIVMKETCDEDSCDSDDEPLRTDHPHYYGRGWRPDTAAPGGGERRATPDAAQSPWEPVDDSDDEAATTTAAKADDALLTARSIRRQRSAKPDWYVRRC